MAQSVQSTLVVVGDPWAPEILDFTPRRAHRGTWIRINGKRFSEVLDENVVTFGTFSTRPEPNEPARARVLKADKGALVVQVPGEAKSGSIVVTVKDRGTASTSSLAVPYKSFEVIPDPVIMSLQPNPPIAGRTMIIKGEHFRGVEDNLEVVFGSGAKPKPISVSDSRIVVRVANSVSSNSVVVQVQGRTSYLIAFTPELPEVFGIGADIRVTTVSDVKAKFSRTL
jgi:hypothetical protein